MKGKQDQYTQKPKVELRNIWKRFPGVIANKGVSLDLRTGEVHALLGENGAGKTTLMNILAGIYRQDAGDILLNGEKVNINSPTDALKIGIGMVHQHFRLVDNMTVAENIHLGWKNTPWHISRESLSKRLIKISEDLGFSLDLTSEIWQLSCGEQQRAEILRSLVRGAQILILDEPTAVLTPEEAADLFRVIRKLVSKGSTIVFISHKLGEVLEISDRVTIMRGGENIKTMDTKKCDQTMLAALMVGRDIELKRYQHSQPSSDVILRVRDLRALNDRGLPAIRGVDLDINAGEILGIAGVSGNGQTELAEVLTGIRPPLTGEITVAGKDLSTSKPRGFSDAGVGHIPEDRSSTGIFPRLSLVHNAILRKYLTEPIGKGLNIDRGEAIKYTHNLITRSDVRAAGIDLPAGKLSGGNQQKLIVQREIDIASKLLIAVHPSRGLDVGATEEVREALVSHRDSGNAILLISEDLDEIMMLSDRIMVVYEGRLVGNLLASEVTKEQLGLLMGGKTTSQGESNG